MTLYQTSQLHKRVVDITGLSSVDIAGDGAVGYVIEIDGVCWYFDINWIQSDLSISQTNTIAELVAQLGTIDAKLNQVDGSNVNMIAVIDYTSIAGDVTELKMITESKEVMDHMPTRIIVDISNNQGVAIEGVKVTAQLTNIASGKPPKYKNVNIKTGGDTAYTNEYGVAILEAFSNDIIDPNGTRTTITIDGVGSWNYIIPVAWQVNLSDLNP